MTFLLLGVPWPPSALPSLAGPAHVPHVSASSLRWHVSRMHVEGRKAEMRMEGRIPLGVPLSSCLDQTELTGPGRGTKTFPADPDVPLELFIDKSMASLEAPGEV